MTERTEAEHIAVLERLKNTWPFEHEVVDSIQWALDKIKGSDWKYIEDGLPVDTFVTYNVCTVKHGIGKATHTASQVKAMVENKMPIYAYRVRTHREDVPPPVRSKS